MEPGDDGLCRMKEHHGCLPLGLLGSGHETLGEVALMDDLVCEKRAVRGCTP